MASVAICPHCYLQLVVPDGVEPNERVECPTCAKEFDLERAVLRAIPEIIRRQPSVTAVTDSITVAESPELSLVEEVIEIESLASDLDQPEEPDVIEQIKSRIECELSAGNLLPGMSASLSLETPDGLEDVASRPEAESELLDEWHRPTVRIHDLTSGDEHHSATDEPETAADEQPPAADLIDDYAAPAIVDAIEDLDQHAELESTPTAQLESDEQIESVEQLEHIEQVENVALPQAAELEPESVEPPVERSSLTTLADLMARADLPAPEDQEEAQVTGPSFELPNVPLTPPISATVEFDPSMTFGPAAESEFELDQVDFDSTPLDERTQEYSEEFSDEHSAERSDEPVEESFTNEWNADSAIDEAEDAPAESDEPVFREPAAGVHSDAPFILPAVPRPRKKRSLVRTLAGTVIGGMVGILAACYILLFLRGPEGDLFGIAQFLPKAVLPGSFSASSPDAVAANRRPATDESANVPATYTEELPKTDDSAADDKASSEAAASDERYGDEPSPLDEPTAEPIDESISAATTPPLPLRGPTFTIDQLATALDSATAAQAGLLTGDLNDAAVRRAKGMSYSKMCDLAEALTFVDRSSPSVESEQAIDGADRLFRETLSDPRIRKEVDRIAAIWIDSPHRRHGGVFLAGTLSGGEIAGEVYEYELATDNGAKLTLLAAEPLDPSVEGSQQPVGIVGSIVARPAEVAGYQGTAQRAIWVTRAIPLE